MSPIEIAETLRRTGLLPDAQAAQLIDFERKRPFSLHGELRTILYGGILTLATGLGLLLYDQTVDLSRNTILLGIGGLCAGCFWLAVRNAPAWSWAEVPSPAGLGSYALLLGCLLLLGLEGYAQYAYQVFGTRYGLATLLPGLLFLSLAYRLDNQGVLALGLTLLTSWVGLTIRPLDLYFRTNFFSPVVIWSAIALASGQIGLAVWMQGRGLKAHFTLTWLVFAANLLFVAVLGGLFNLESLRLVFAGLLAGACLGYDWLARREQSFLLLLLTAVYGYIGGTYLFFHYTGIESTLPTGLYFVVSGIGLIVFLLNRRPQTEADERV
jgi:Predicted membrane protein (DUF2157)